MKVQGIIVPTNERGGLLEPGEAFQMTSRGMISQLTDVNTCLDTQSFMHDRVHIDMRRNFISEPSLV